MALQPFHAFKQRIYRICTRANFSLVKKNADEVNDESVKAVIRGQAISFLSHKKKKDNSRLKEIEHNILAQESLYKTNPMKTILENLKKIKK